MTGNTLILVIMCSSLVFSESRFVDNIKKCSIKEDDCKAVLQSVISSIGKTGIPEYGIPAIDPYVVKNLSVTVLDMMHVTMVDGVAKGAKDCVVEKLDINLEKGRTILEMTCDVTIKGKYKASGTLPLFQGVLGGNLIHADGTAKIKIEKMKMKFDYPRYVREKDGELFFEDQFKDLKFNYSVGKINFSANNLYIGDSDISEPIVNIMNENWKLVLDSFGKPFIDTAMDIIYKEIIKFFNTVPTKYYITDDLKPYVKKD